MSGEILTMNFDPVLEKAIANGAVKMSKALRLHGDCTSFDIEKSFLTRAWGREKKEAGVAAMSDVNEGARQMLTLEQVLGKVPVGKSTLRRMIRNKDFPGPHFISPRKMVWYDDEVAEWQANLPRTKAAAAKRK